jgi:dTDP-4-dehydrorhamnose 3,5-epimerase
MSKHIKKTTIPGLYKVTRQTFADERGFFREVFHLDELLKETGIDFKPVQWNHSLSAANVIRGLHAENWNKLIYPVTGKMFAAIVDIRPDSPTFSKVETFVFSHSEKYALFISKGLANSICVIGDEAVNYMYLVDAYYDGTDSTAFAWDDPDLAIQWPNKNPIISTRDKSNSRLRDLFPYKFIKE